MLKMIHIFCDVMPSRWTRRYEESCCLHTQDQAATIRLRTIKSSTKGRETQTLFTFCEVGRYEHFSHLTCFHRINSIQKKKSGSRNLKLLGPENGSKIIFRNVGKYLPNDIPQDLGL